MSDVRFLGTSDEVTTCECCGRSRLKSTVALQFEDCGDPVFFGVSCAARALAGRGIKTSAAEVRKATRLADDAKAEAVRHARNAEWAAEDARWDAFLNARAPHLRGNRFEQIAACGGYAAARAAYRAL